MDMDMKKGCHHLKWSRLWVKYMSKTQLSCLWRIEKSFLSYINGGSSCRGWSPRRVAVFMSQEYNKGKDTCGWKNGARRKETIWRTMQVLDVEPSHSAHVSRDQFLQRHNIEAYGWLYWGMSCLHMGQLINLLFSSICISEIPHPLEVFL